MTSLTEFLNSKIILEWMWAHGKFLTDSQAQAIINKIDQKQDGKVKHKVSVVIFTDLNSPPKKGCIPFASKFSKLAGSLLFNLGYAKILVFPPSKMIET